MRTRVLSRLSAAPGPAHASGACNSWRWSPRTAREGGLRLVKCELRKSANNVTSAPLPWVGRTIMAAPSSSALVQMTRPTESASVAKRSTACRTMMPCTPASSGTSLLVMYFSAASRCKRGAFQSSHLARIQAGGQRRFGSWVHSSASMLTTRRTRSCSASGSGTDVKTPSPPSPRAGSSIGYVEGMT